MKGIYCKGTLKLASNMRWGRWTFRKDSGDNAVNVLWATWIAWGRIWLIQWFDDANSFMLLGNKEKLRRRSKKWLRRHELTVQIRPDTFAGPFDGSNITKKCIASFYFFSCVSNRSIMTKIGKTLTMNVVLMYVCCPIIVCWLGISLSVHVIW